MVTTMRMYLDNRHKCGMLCTGSRLISMIICSNYAIEDIAIRIRNSSSIPRCKFLRCIVLNVLLSILYWTTFNNNLFKFIYRYTRLSYNVSVHTIWNYQIIIIVYDKHDNKNSHITKSQWNERLIRQLSRFWCRFYGQSSRVL